MFRNANSIHLATGRIPLGHDQFVHRNMDEEVYSPYLTHTLLIEESSEATCLELRKEKKKKI